MGERHRGLAVVEHVVAADLIGAIGQTTGMAIIGRHQEQSGAVGRPTTHHHDITAIGELFTIAFHLDGRDRGSLGVGHQALHLSAGQERDRATGLEGRPNATDLGIPFGMDHAGEAIAVVAAPATAVVHIRFVQHHATGGMKRIQSSRAEIIGELLNPRFVGDRRMGVGR